jgi:hypothetical protein
VACISLALVLTVDARAESEIYKYVDEDGVVSFSSKPPPEATEVKPVDVPEGNIIHKRKLTDKEKEFQRMDKELSKKLDRRISESKKRAHEITSAKQEVKKKKEALESGKIIKPGDRIGTASGHSRLRPSYYERVKQLEEQLKIAEEKLKKLDTSYIQ